MIEAASNTPTLFMRRLYTLAVYPCLNVRAPTLESRFPPPQITCPGRMGVFTILAAARLRTYLPASVRCYSIHEEHHTP